MRVISNTSWLMLFALSLLWGGSFIFVEVLLVWLNPFMIVFLRVGLASLVLLPICIMRGLHRGLGAGDWFNLVIMGILNNVLPFCMIVVGQQSTTGGLASILNSSTAFFSLLLSALLLGDEQLTSRRLFGVILGIVGVSVVIGLQDLANLFSTGSGKYLIILASVSYAFAGVWGRRRMAGMPPMMAAGGMLTTSSIIMAAGLWLFDLAAIDLLTPMVFGYALALAMLCSVLAYILYFRILEQAGASNLLLCTIIIPPAAILLDALFLGQLISIRETSGLGLVILGLLIIDGRLISWLRQGSHA